MRATDFIREFEARKGVRLRRRGNRITATSGKLSEAHRTLIALHRPQLLAALAGDDTVELTAAAIEEKDYEAVGLFMVPHGTRPTHDHGDEYADLILSGLISIEAARAEETHAGTFERRYNHPLKGRIRRWLLHHLV